MSADLEFLCFLSLSLLSLLQAIEQSATLCVCCATPACLSTTVLTLVLGGMCALCAPLALYSYVVIYARLCCTAFVSDSFIFVLLSLFDLFEVCFC